MPNLLILTGLIQLPTSTKGSYHTKPFIIQATCMHNYVQLSALTIWPSFDSLLVNSWLHNRRGTISGIHWANISPHISTHLHSDYHKKYVVQRDCNDSHSSSHSLVYTLITYVLWQTKHSSFHHCVVIALRPCPLTGWKNWINGKFQIWHNHLAATGRHK